MAAPATPRSFSAQAGNGTIFLSWDLSVGATSYTLNRSSDSITYAVLASSIAANSYYDTTAVLGSTYYYTVQASNGELSIASSAQSATAVQTGVMTLGQLRLEAQQRADRVNSNFVTKTEWNSYINQSMLELYDLLITCYEDYYLAPEYTFQTDGSSSYTLPNGVLTGVDSVVTKPFYKLMGVDMGISASNQARVTVHNYNFMDRNNFVYPNIQSTAFGIFNLRYRVMGSKIHFTPTPSSAQFITIHYVPRLPQLLADSDTADFVSGWTEYIIVDAAIKALQKEESDVSILLNQKMMLKQRIEESAMNRDAGEPQTITNSRGNSGGFGDRNGGFNGGY